MEKVEVVKKFEIPTGDHWGIEVSELPQKKGVRLRVIAPPEWATIDLTTEQWETLCNLRYSLEAR